MFAKVAGPQISSAYRKSANYICGPPTNVTNVDLRFADPIFCVIFNLKTPTSPQIHNFLFLQIYEACKVLFQDIFVQFFVKICGFVICESSMQICGFADLAQLRKLRICDSGMRPRICIFAICGL